MASISTDEREAYYNRLVDLEVEIQIAIRLTRALLQNPIAEDYDTLINWKIDSISRIGNFNVKCLDLINEIYEKIV